MKSKSSKDVWKDPEIDIIQSLTELKKIVMNSTGSHIRVKKPPRYYIVKKYVTIPTPVLWLQNQGFFGTNNIEDTIFSCSSYAECLAKLESLSAQVRASHDGYISEAEIHYM